MPTFSSSRKPPYFATPDDTREAIKAPFEGIIDGERDNEYWRACGRLDEEQLMEVYFIRWLDQYAEGASISEIVERFSAHWRNSSRDRLASSAP
jgi:hypothetical protein